MTLGLEGFMRNSDPPEPLIVIVYDDRPAIERMISTPADSLKHAFDAVETMKLTYEVKKITLWELAMAMITIAMEKDILQGRS